VAFFRLLLNLTKRVATYTKYSWRSRFFFVSHGQISEIIGDELWMDSEINCLCNVASGRKIWLTLGSKRKSVDPMEINIGDWVTVSNHGIFFP
jgi:hypothetical protein